MKSSILLSTKILLVAICAYWTYMGYQFMTSSPYFAISDVLFSGQHKLNEETLLKTTGPLKGQNTFLLDAGEISRKLAEHPMIEDASIQRMFPRGMEITIKERSPFARIQLDRIGIMDKFGILISEDSSEYSALPLIIGTPGKKPALGENVATENVISGLKTMYSLNRLPFFKNNPVYAARVEANSRIIFLTKDSDLQVIMGLNTSSEDRKKLLIALDMLEGSVNQIEYIDLSFKDQVVVKHRKDFTPAENYSQANT